VRIEIRGAERLSLRERQVVALKETGFGNDAIARRLGISPTSVATLLHRAKAKGYEVVMVLEGDPLGIFGEVAGGDEEGDEGEA
jgi:DNA-directed RNA polymerase specialized sigma24 family protein